MIDASALNISFGVFGAQGAIEAINAVSSAFDGAARSGIAAYRSHETLQLSLQALSRKELLAQGAFEDPADPALFDEAAKRAARLALQEGAMMQTIPRYPDLV